MNPLFFARYSGRRRTPANRSLAVEVPLYYMSAILAVSFFTCSFVISALNRENRFCPGKRLAIRSVCRFLQVFLHYPCSMQRFLQPFRNILARRLRISFGNPVRLLRKPRIEAFFYRVSRAARTNAGKKTANQNPYRFLIKRHGLRNAIVPVKKCKMNFFILQVSYIISSNLDFAIQNKIVFRSTYGNRRFHAQKSNRPPRGGFFGFYLPIFSETPVIGKTAVQTPPAGRVCPSGILASDRSRSPSANSFVLLSPRLPPTSARRPLWTSQ